MGSEGARPLPRRGRAQDRRSRLPNTDEVGTRRVAGEVHSQVSGLAVPLAGIGAGAVTVSIGSATGAADAASLYGRADAAFYEAKAGGRNQTRCAASVLAGSVVMPPLRVVWD
jgi:hypothetical protein